MSGKIRQAWWATVVLFLVHGLIVATWVSRIPAVQSALGLNNGVLGLTLLSSAVGAVSTIPFAGFLIGKFGSKKVCVVSSVMFCLSVTLMGAAFNAVTLACGLFVFGGGAAAMDVAMNAQGVEGRGSGTHSRSHRRGRYQLRGRVGRARSGPHRHGRGFARTDAERAHHVRQQRPHRSSAATPDLPLAGHRERLRDYRRLSSGRRSEYLAAAVRHGFGATGGNDRRAARSGDELPHFGGGFAVQVHGAGLCVSIPEARKEIRSGRGLGDHAARVRLEEAARAEAIS